MTEGEALAQSKVTEQWLGVVKRNQEMFADKFEKGEYVYFPAHTIEIKWQYAH